MTTLGQNITTGTESLIGLSKIAMHIFVLEVEARWWISRWKL